MIYKKNGVFDYEGEIEPYIVQTESELSGIAQYGNAQAAIILGTGDGLTLKFRLPGGEWTEV